MPNVHFAGRLATYKYYNMDQVVAQALTLFNKVAASESDIVIPSSATITFGRRSVTETRDGVAVAKPSGIRSNGLRRNNSVPRSKARRNGLHANSNGEHNGDPKTENNGNGKAMRA